MQKIRLGVIYGGPSVEHEIAVISAVQAMAAADEQKYQIVPIYLSKDGLWYTGDILQDMAAYSDLPALLGKCRRVYMTADRGAHKLIARGKGLFARDEELPLDVILPVMHGAHGEDGCLQGFLELLNIPYAGPGVLAAAVGMDKIMMKNVLAANELPVLPGVWFTADEWYADQEGRLAEAEQKLGYPMIVKPANLGSSVGIARAADRAGLIEALNDAAAFSGRLLIEPCLDERREINCAVLGYGAKVSASVCEEPLTDNAFLTYQDKYMSGGKSAKGGKLGGQPAKGGAKAGMGSSRRQIPADLPEDTAAEIQALSKRAFVALDGCGVARIDVMIDKRDGKIYINEINTIPGSLAFYLWQAGGLDFPALIDELVAGALARSRAKDKLTFSYDTNILAGFAAGAGGVKGGVKS